MYNIDFCMCFSSENISPPIGGNHYELDNEEPVEGVNAYEALVPAASGSKSSASENAPPPVYAAVDKENRQGNTVCKDLEDNYVNMRSKVNIPLCLRLYGQNRFKRTRQTNLKKFASVSPEKNAKIKRF